jgi:hypothetical protein
MIQIVEPADCTATPRFVYDSHAHRSGVLKRMSFVLGVARRWKNGFRSVSKLWRSGANLDSTLASNYDLPRPTQNENGMGRFSQVATPLRRPCIWSEPVAGSLSWPFTVAVRADVTVPILASLPIPFLICPLTFHNMHRQAFSNYLNGLASLLRAFYLAFPQSPLHPETDGGASPEPTISGFRQ